MTSRYLRTVVWAPEGGDTLAIEEESLHFPPGHYESTALPGELWTLTGFSIKFLVPDEGKHCDPSQAMVHLSVVADNVEANVWSAYARRKGDLPDIPDDWWQYHNEVPPIRVAGPAILRLRTFNANPQPAVLYVGACWLVEWVGGMQHG